MAIKQQNFLTYEEYDLLGDIEVSAALLSITLLNVRHETAYVYKEKESADEYEYETNVYVTAAYDGAVPSVWMTADGVGDFWDMRVAGTEAISFIFHTDSVGERGFQLNHVTGAGASESSYNSFDWLLYTNYRINISRDNQTVTAEVYDEDDGGAHRATIVLTASARALADHQNLYAFASWDDSWGTALFTATIGPMYDNNAQLGMPRFFMDPLWTPLIQPLASGLGAAPTRHSKDKQTLGVG